MDQEAILNFYCDNEMRELKKICYPIFKQIGGISQSDYDDLYSIALDTLVYSVFRFDESKKCKFLTYLIGNLNRKYDTYIRDRNRLKRIPSKMIESFSDLVTEDGMELSETIPSGFDTFEEAFGTNFEGTYIEEYLRRLSIKQREIVNLLFNGYKPKEIREKLHMRDKEYKEHFCIISAYENIRILERKTYRKELKV